MKSHFPNCYTFLVLGGETIFWLDALNFRQRPSRCRWKKHWIPSLLVSCLTGFYNVVSLHRNDSISSCLVRSNPVDLGTSHTVILPLGTVSVLCVRYWSSSRPDLCYKILYAAPMNDNVNDNELNLTKQISKIDKLIRSIEFRQTSLHSILNGLNRSICNEKCII